MSALQFDRVEQRNGLFSARNCSHPNCNGAGRYRAWILGRMVGLLCGRHRNEWTRSWDAAAGAEQ
jgi:hypothetical protein